MSSETPQGVKISAYLFFANAVLYILLFCGAIGFAGLMASQESDLAGVGGIAFGACFILLFVLLYAAVGYGLLQLKSWARIAAIILAILALCSFPIGTIIGGIVLYFMFQEEAKQAFS